MSIRIHTLLAQICLWAGILGAASGIFLAVYPADVDSDRYSYPLTAAAFAVIQVWFFIQHLGLIAGIEAVRRSRVEGSRPGIALALGGLGLLAVVELLAIGAANSPYPSPRTDWLDVGYGLSTTAIGIGLVLAGIATVRAQVWSGWLRWLVLAMGIYVFVPMLPAMLGGFLSARLAITGWMLLFAVLGWAIERNERAIRTQSVPSRGVEA